jgi:hypothetical protein
MKKKTQKKAIKREPLRVWQNAEIRTLKQMCKAGQTAAQIARKLKRTVAAIYSRVQVEGLALGRKNRLSAKRPAKTRQRRR